jgi:CRP-like cAMP-binding protein
MARKPRRRSSIDHGSALADALEAAGIDPDRAARLNQMHFTVISARSGEWLREPGLPRPEVMLVREGLLSKHKVATEGPGQVVALRYPGEAILPRLGPAPYGLRALAKSEVFAGDGREFMMIVNADAYLTKVVWAVIQRNEAIAHEWLINRGRRGGAARVAHLLLESCVRSGIDIGKEPFRNPFRQQDIAQITGQTSINVGKVLADLAHSGLIERSGREIRFKRLPELLRLANFDPAYLSFPTL